MEVQESLLLLYMGPLLSHAGSKQVSAMITFFRNTEKTLHTLGFLLQPLHSNSAVAYKGSELSREFMCVAELDK